MIHTYIRVRWFKDCFCGDKPSELLDHSCKSVDRETSFGRVLGFIRPGFLLSLLTRWPWEGPMPSDLYTHYGECRRDELKRDSEDRAGHWRWHGIVCCRRESSMWRLSHSLSTWAVGPFNNVVDWCHSLWPLRRGFRLRPTVWMFEASCCWITFSAWLSSSTYKRSSDGIFLVILLPPSSWFVLLPTKC